MHNVAPNRCVMPQIEISIYLFRFHVHAVHSLVRKGTGVARVKRTSGHMVKQILCKQNVDKFTCQVINSFAWDLIVSVPDHCLSFYFAIFF